MAYHFLTGATGLLGRYLLRDLLVAGVPVAVLVRPTRRATIRQRVESLMCYWDEQMGRPLPRPVVLEGDICQPDLGLDARSRTWVAEHVDTFVHNAASLTFQSTGPESEPWRSNLHGTRHALELCRDAGIRKFHHVSTAYVCGLREGLILESELDVGQTPSNDYEKSKILAETMVHGADFLDSRTIYRPSIIIGDSQTGYTTTFHGFYAPLQIVNMMVKGMTPNETGRVQSHASVGILGHERKNLVPVDWVSAVTSHILTHPEHHGQTYHLTPRHPVKLRMFRDVLEQATQFYAASMVGENRPEHMTEYERLFFDHLQVYNSYWRDDPEFDASNTIAAAPHLPCPHVDRAMLLKLSQWAIDTNFGGGRTKQVEPEFDAHRYLEHLLLAGHDDTSRAAFRLLGLQVDGHGGGQWHLILKDGTIVAADMGIDSRCSATYRLDVATLASLARGDCTPSQAMETGHLTVIGNGLSKRELAGVLQQVTATAKV